MRFGEQVSGQRSEAAKTVRYEHAILLSASSHHCAQFSRYVKAASSQRLHKLTRGGLIRLGTPDIGAHYAVFVRVRRGKLVIFPQEYLWVKKKTQGRWGDEKEPPKGLFNFLEERELNGFSVIFRL